jgi:hypothetical protein
VELGRVPDEATARAVLAAIAEPVVREQLREGYRTGVLGWLRDMWASGQLVLPPGATGGDLVAEWEELGARGARSGWVPLADELRCIRAGDAHVIAYPLACLDQEHGRRIEELVRRRDSDRLRLVRDVVARCARNSGD